MKLRRRVPRILLALALIGGVVGAASAIAGASIPTAGGVINGCYDPRSAYVRVVDAALGQTCTTAEKALNWNQTGPQGPAGPAGPTGPAGPAGPAGGFRTVSRGTACAGTCASDYYSTYLEAWAGCPAGMKVVGGGYEVVPGRYSNGTKYDVVVQRNGPATGYEYWVVGVKIQSLSFEDLKVTAMCVS